jgi:hypothetical protein
MNSPTVSLETGAGGFSAASNNVTLILLENKPSLSLLGEKCDRKGEYTQATKKASIYAHQHTGFLANICFSFPNTGGITVSSHALSAIPHRPTNGP